MTRPPDTLCAECQAPKEIHCLPGETLCVRRYCAACLTPEAAEHEVGCIGHIEGKARMLQEREARRWPTAPAKVCQGVHGQSGLACEILLAENEESHAGRYHRNGDLQWTSLANEYRPVTKDSGARMQHDSGVIREGNADKARFELLIPLGVPFEAQLLTRVAELVARGAKKYADRNWEQATGAAEMEDFKSSALRHMMQWASGETDEDHAAAVVFNLLAHETTKWKKEK